LILAPVEVVGVDNFGDWAVTLKLRIKTMPMKQWEVGRELRKRILKTLSAHGVEHPFPAPQSVASQLEARRMKAVGPEGQ
jgi:small conductance mechanosensitive channel